VTPTPPNPLDVRSALAKKLAQQERRRRWLQRSGVVVGVVAVAVILPVTILAVVNSKSPGLRRLPGVQFAVPSDTAGCGGAVALEDGAFQVPITFSRSGGSARMYVNICMDGQGPFPFVVDTGSATTTIDSSLARRLDLPKVGNPQRDIGAGCTLRVELEELTSWSMAGVPLEGQAIAVRPSPGVGENGEPYGLLGADVLSRFGAVRFDFGAQTMTLPGVEGPAPRTKRTLNGPLPTPIPPALASGAPNKIVELDESEGPGFTLVATPVQFVDTYGTVELVVDTGSTRSIVDASLLLNLAKTDFTERVVTVCAQATVPVVESGRWSVGTVQLPPSMILSSNLAALERNGVSGTLGLDELSRFQYAIIDFTGGELAFGPRIP